MENRYWLIEGYDGTNKIFCAEYKAGIFSESKMKQLLKVLVAKAALNYEEIIGAYANRNSKISNEYLSIQKDGKNPVYTCGDNPYFVASIVSGEKKNR